MNRFLQLSTEDIFFASSGVCCTSGTTNEQRREKMAYVPRIQAEFLALPESRLV